MHTSANRCPTMDAPESGIANREHPQLDICPSCPSSEYVDEHRVHVGAHRTVTDLPDVTQKNQGPIGSPAVTASTTSVAAETTSATPAIKHSSNIGPIVGGTIGGIGVLVLVLVLACLVFRARRRWHGSQAPSQQYINKWSKNVPIGGSSGWMGTPFSASVSGDPIKEGDMMSGSYPYSVEPRSTINSPTYLDQARARGSISPTRSDGHQSSTKPRRGFHLHSPAASNVTPFVLPPLAAPTVVTGSAALSHDGTSMISSNVAQHSHRGSQQAATMELPSKIEYLGQRRPPVPTTSTNAAGVSTIGSRNGSRTSFSSLLPGQYNPDDPSTFLAGASAGGSSERNDVERPGYRRHHSSDLPPSSFNPLSPLSPSSGSGNYPDAQQEKAALARQYAQTPATRGHHSSSMSPPQLSPPQLNTNLAMTASVHTLPGLPTPNPTTPLEQPTSHTPSESVPAEPNSFLSTWRKKANRRSVDLDADPVPTWAQQGSADDFDPYRMT